MYSFCWTGHTFVEIFRNLVMYPPCLNFEGLGQNPFGGGHGGLNDKNLGKFHDIYEAG